MNRKPKVKKKGTRKIIFEEDNSNDLDFAIVLPAKVQEMQFRNLIVSYNNIVPGSLLNKFLHRISIIQGLNWFMNESKC